MNIVAARLALADLETDQGMCKRIAGHVNTRCGAFFSLFFRAMSLIVRMLDCQIMHMWLSSFLK